MWVFRAAIDTLERGVSMSPQIKTFCPHCTATIAFYSKLHDNRCRLCNKEMPFDSRMAKDQQKRVEYHVETETEGKTDGNINVHFLPLRERN